MYAAKDDGNDTQFSVSNDQEFFQYLLVVLAMYICTSSLHYDVYPMCLPQYFCFDFISGE